MAIEILRYEDKDNKFEEFKRRLDLKSNKSQKEIAFLRRIESSINLINELKRLFSIMAISSKTCANPSDILPFITDEDGHSI